MKRRPPPPQQQNKIRDWLFDPVLFVREAVRPPMISGQQEEGLREYGKIVLAKMKRAESQPMTEEERQYADVLGLSIQSGQGTGKDAFCSWCVLHFLTCMPFPKILCTAPSGPQLDVILWPEIHKWLRHSILQEAIKWQAEKVYLREYGGREWFAVKRTIQTNASADQQAETLAGLHEDYMLYAVDEASGVPDPVFNPVEGSMTGKVNFALVIFNPTKYRGYALDTQTKNRAYWVCLHWPADESELVPKEKIERDRKKYGEQSNYFRIRVKGIPPRAEEDALIPLEWVQACVNLELEADQFDISVAGLDPSGGGEDDSALVYGVGPCIKEVLTASPSKTDSVVYWAFRHMQEMDCEVLGIDVIGWGAGIYTELDKLCTASVLAINAAEVPVWEPDRFMRLRDEMYWHMRELFEKSLISIPDDDELIGELTVPKWKFVGKKIKVEGKPDLRQRGIASPNKADALVLREHARRLYGRRKPHTRQRPRMAESWKTL